MIYCLLCARARESNNQELCTPAKDPILKHFQPIQKKSGRKLERMESRIPRRFSMDHSA